MKMRDIDIRTALRTSLQSTIDTDTRLIDELGICEGKVRIDMATVNGIIHGYEIKSESDTLNRLPQQQDLYSRSLDKVTIVINENHHLKVAALVPEWWGITVASMVSDRVVLSDVRPSLPNAQLDPRYIVQFLWKEETLDFLRERNIRGYSGKKRTQLWDMLVDACTFEELCSLVRNQLKVREGWRVDSRPL